MSKAVFTGLLVLTFSAPPVLALLAAAPATEGPRLVLHAPWADGPELVRAAGGKPLGPYRAAMGVLASAPDSDAFDHRLRAAGAWAVVDGRAVAALCGADGQL